MLVRVVAGAAVATAAVVGGLYRLMKQPEAVAVWTKPEADWLKLNVHGSRLPEFIYRGCGGVLRDETGNWVYGFAQKLDVDLREDETEKEGIFIGLKWARDKGVRKVMVESDNKRVVELVNNGRRSSDPLICGIRDLLDSPHWEAILTWVHADANKLAAKVANFARFCPDFDLLQEFDFPPDLDCFFAVKDTCTY